MCPTNGTSFLVQVFGTGFWCVCPVIGIKIVLTFISASSDNKFKTVAILTTVVYDDEYFLFSQWSCMIH